MASINKTFSAMQQLGAIPLIQYGIYKMGLKTGTWQRLINKQRQEVSNWRPVAERARSLIPLPGAADLDEYRNAHNLLPLLKECQEIQNGQVRLFGGEPTTLKLFSSLPLPSWTAYETGKTEYDPIDPKFTWESGRFAWAYTLGRGYHLTGDERWAELCWQNTETFLENNPPYLGPHWASAQEVALRLMAFAWILRVLQNSNETAPERQSRLVQALADHAARIPPTMIYARSQNNNHLLTESAGLYTAGLLLEGTHPRAENWKKLGWRSFHHALQEQITSDGAYIQHSTNYQRLMLQTALWVHVLARNEGDPFPIQSLERLAAATDWMLDRLDPESGYMPNLGANDGAYIFPFTSLPFKDYRPVLIAASSACQVDPNRLMGREPTGMNNEMSLWFGLPEIPHSMDANPPTLDDREILSTPTSWAVLRATRFDSRPGHADQLHLDLWWQGMNLTQDAGTYRYTAEPPWDNALTHAAVHNTVTIDGRDQMTRAGRFLYLDWAQAEIFNRERADDGSWECISARHNGYRQLGIIHQRKVTAYQAGEWRVADSFLSDMRRRKTASVFRVHWLLPDWLWEVKEDAVLLDSPGGTVTLQVTASLRDQPTECNLVLVRAGERLYGANDPPHTPILGWFSPTYSVKIPALSLVAEITAPPTVKIESVFSLPG